MATIRRQAATGRFVMKPTITAFRDSPDRGQGLARDMQVHWALEEAVFLAASCREAEAR